MLGLTGLNRKVTIYMAAVALGGLAITTLGWGLIYFLFVDTKTLGDEDALHFHPVDYLALAIFSVIGLISAVAAATSLSKRIVLPVSAVAQAARKVSGGDLTARVEITDQSMGEVVDLAHDFNMMAARLEGLANEAVQWNAAIAHELRTPLTILKVRLQGLTDGVYEFDDEFRRSLVTQVDGLTRLVEDLRSLSLAESGRLHLAYGDVALDRIIEDMRVLMDAPLRKAGFIPEWIGEEVVVVADAMRVRQAVLALVENARVHATPGPVSIRASAEGDTAVVSVTDTGPGVSPEALSRMFLPFAHEPSRKGSGLGLAVVRSIAEAHGGSAGVQPTPDGGSCFEIRLPLERRTAP